MRVIEAGMLFLKTQRKAAWLGCLLFALLVSVDLTIGQAVAAPSPFGVALPETTGPISQTGIWGRIQGWILAQQSSFYMALKDAVKLIETDKFALLTLLGMSFGYGIFHAAGPGHGKVVLTTYLFASGATARKGALLALIAAMVQASVAVGLIAIAALLLNATSMVITQTAQLLELASYAMFVLLGLWLLWRAVKAFRKAAQVAVVGETAHAHVHDHHSHAKHGHHHHHDDNHHHNHHNHNHDHDHGGDCSCGHSHAPSLELVESASGMRGMALAVVSMGLRPCSGALIVLVFALSQQVFWAGILSAYAMGLGTGLAIALIALFASYARHASNRLAGKGISERAMHWFSASVLFVAGLIVLAFGGVLLLANLL